MAGRRRNRGRATRSLDRQLAGDENIASDSKSQSDAWESTTDGGASPYLSPEGTPEREEDEETDDFRSTKSNSKSHTMPSTENSRPVEQAQDAETSTAGRTSRRTPDLDPQTTIIGAPLGRNLSLIEAADALVDRWELIYHQAIENHGTEAVAGIAEQLEQAREKRTALDLVEDRRTVEEPFQQTRAYEFGAVADRVEDLRELLKETSNEDVKANIQGAIDCYEDRQLGVSKKFAIFYAGRFMEFADSYEEFTEDRPDRIDRYAARCGPGSLWYEPPLCEDTYDVIAPSLHAMRGTVARPSVSNTHRVTMSFQGLQVLPGRSIPSDSSTGRFESTWGNLPYNERTVGRFRPDNSKPRLAFRMVLDSGASYPCIYDKDFKALGVNCDKYAAVSCHKIFTANGKIRSYVYELYVTVCDTLSAEPLVDPKRPVWPQRRHELGGIQRVVKFTTSMSEEPPLVAELNLNGSVKQLCRNWAAEREETIGRLSGMLPFQCCYVQSTPGLNEIWFGEDRKDVLGAHRMPGQMRFEPGIKLTFDTDHPKHVWDTLKMGNEGNPVLLRMVHEVNAPDGSRILRLQDCEGENSHGVSEVSVVDGTGWLDPITIEPKTNKRKYNNDALAFSDQQPVKKTKTWGLWG